MRVAIIPARGGSKRIPGKNIRPFLGHPMISWPIAVARASGLFDRVLVSTDDAAIAAAAREAGAEVPFLRDAALADDHATVTAVVQDAVRRLNLTDDAMACLIYATAALIRPADLRAGLDALEATGADYALSVASFPAPVDRALVIAGGHLSMLNPANLFTRSQDLPEAYHDAGQFCWGRAGAWLSERRAMSAPTAPVILPRARVQDIDTPEDWDHAEALARAMGLTAPGPDTSVDPDPDAP